MGARTSVLHRWDDGRGPVARRRPLAALGIAAALVLGTVPLTAQADEVDLTPGPTVYADPNSPTGYTGRFVYYNPDASSVRFVADIQLRNWADTSDPTVYQPEEYFPGLMRGGGGYDVEMTDAGDGYWVTDVPLAAGANQYWFYVDNNTNLWVADPANSPIFAPDGLTGEARRAFNKVFVPYDAEKQDFEPLAARQIELPREDSQKGSWSYVPFEVSGTTRTMGVYLPPGYDPDRAEPYKTIYMQHGGGQDQSDWMNMGNVPVIMDNLIQDGDTEPAVVVTTNTNYLGAPAEGYPNLRDVVLPFVEANYNVSGDVIDRAFAGLSAGSIVTQNLINYDPTLFGYYGPWSGGARLNTTTPNLAAPYILFGGGQWDFGLPNAGAVAAFDDVAFVENEVVAGAHDFNAWNQLFTIFARDYVWQPESFLEDEFSQLIDGVAASSLNRGNKNALTVKLEKGWRDLQEGDTASALRYVERFDDQLTRFASNGQLPQAEADAMNVVADQVVFNLGYWQR
ncbi:alpha/beta hydrolase-fold protein [Microbacterium sp. ET2]|uniref:alpha/beta hydrolase n=1 Tax=Microbacterium albipurpureum TaxID=3050384 RepID=UPI00259CA199|nr:alpha/beta hydrolase-fold protein [Microbacterium sp. ET2 (Ac-2212)]WJL96547.1 alpha/beta hydrolase-fold protein [Microbacterium sp. ET2 (Ac-2212)]